MDQQHRKIIGYRELNQAEIDVMNKVKAMGKDLGNLLDELRLLPAVHDPEKPDRASADQRWVSIGATQLQQGLMALTRAVAKPEFF